MNNNKSVQIEQSRSDKFFRGEWRQWLDFAATLWDTLSMISVLFIGFVIGITMFVFDYEFKSIEIIGLTAAIASAFAAFGILMSTWLYFNWSGREKLKKTIISLKSTSSPIILEILLESSNEYWNFKKLQDACKEQGPIIIDIHDCEELQKLNFITVRNQAVSLTTKSRSHRDLILETLNTVAPKRIND